MPPVSNAQIMQHYVRLTEFLGLALGPDYEVALHDMTDRSHSIVAIANGHISGREVGAPLASAALGILRDKSYKESNYRLHFRSISLSGRELRSSVLFIKQGRRLLGMLCINFDDSRHRELGERLLGLCHPDGFLQPAAQAEDAPVPQDAPQHYRNSTDGVAQEAIARELARVGVAADRLTPEERGQVIAALERGGIFLLKGAVKDVAAGLKCSPASVYRYLALVKDGKAAPP